MQITIYDWAQGALLKGTKYTYGQKIEGIEDDALGIASELFKLGRNVMLCRDTSGITVCVDNKRFQQR